MAKIIKQALIAAAVAFVTIYTAGTFAPGLLGTMGAAAGTTAFAFAKSMAILTFVGTSVAGGIAMLTSRGIDATRQNFGTKVAGRGAQVARQIVYGKCRVGGTIVKMHVSGNDNSKLHLAIVLAGHEIESLEGVYFGETLLTTTSHTISHPDGGSAENYKKVTNSDFVNSGNDNAIDSGGTLVQFSFMDGSQTRRNGLAATNSSRFPTTAKFERLAYVYMEVVYDPEKLGGLPAMHFLIKGKKVYDPRTSSTAWSDNPALHVRDFLMDTTYGLKATSSEINDTTTAGGFQAAANACEVAVDLNSDGSQTEERFTSNGFVNAAAAPDGVIEGILSACAGKLTYTNGKFNIFVGTAQTPSLTVTDEDILEAQQIATKQGNGELYNGIKALFVDSTQLYNGAETPVYINSTHLLDDTPNRQSSDSANYKKILETQLPFTVTHTMAQRLQKIQYFRQREASSLSLLTTLEYMRLQPGDWVSVTNSRLSYSSKAFEVVSTSMEFGENEGQIYAATRLALQEVSAATYNYIFSEYSTPQTAGSNIPTGDLSIAAPTAGTLSNRTRSEGPTAKIDIIVPWTNATDLAIQGTEVQYREDGASSYDVATIAVRGSTSAVISGVQVGKTYNVRIRHFSFDNVYSSYATYSDITIPEPDTISAPTNLVATTNKPFFIELTWTNPTNGNYRAVEVHFSATDGFTPDSTTLLNSYYGDVGKQKKVILGVSAGLSYDTNYYFRARAVNVYGTASAYTSQVTGKFVQAAAGDLAANSVTANEINVANLSSVSSDLGSITGGSININSGQFTVSSDGAMVAQSATITGSVTSSSGTIGGFTLATDKLSAGTGATTVSMSTADGIHLGATAFGSAPFRVSRAGALTATNATITGAVNASSGTYSGQVAVGSANGTITVIDGNDTDFRLFTNATLDADTNQFLPDDSSFKVGNDGRVFASDITIYNSDGDVLLSPAGLGAAALNDISTTSGSVVSTVGGTVSNSTSEITLTTSSASESFTITSKVAIDDNNDLTQFFSGASTSSTANAEAQLTGVDVLIDYFVKPDGGSYDSSPNVTKTVTIINSGTPSSTQMRVGGFDRGASYSGSLTRYFAIPQDFGGALEIIPNSGSGSSKYVVTTASLGSSLFPSAQTYKIKIVVRVVEDGTTTAISGSTTPPSSDNTTTGIRFDGGNSDERHYEITGSGLIKNSDNNFTSGSQNLLASGGTVSGNLTVTGDFTVQGTTTTIDTATLNVEDKNITLNYGAGDTSASADGSGITIQDAVNSSTDATLNWNATNDRWEFSHQAKTPSLMVGSKERIDSDGDLNNIRNLNMAGTLTSAGTATASFGGAITASADSTITTAGFTRLNINSTRTSGNIGGVDFQASGTIKAQIFGTTDGQMQLTTNGSVVAVNLDASQNATFFGSITATGRSTFDSVTIDDDGSGSPILRVVADDLNPWAFQIENDSATNDGLFQAYVNNNNNLYFRARETGAYPDWYLQVSNGTTVVDVLTLNGSNATFGRTSRHYGNGAASLSWGDTSDVGALSFSGSNAIVRSTVNNADIIFQGNSGGFFEALRLDMSNSGNATFAGTGEFTGGGNTLLLKKGTGNAAIALAGTATDPEASALIEGIAGGGLKVYTSTGTISNPSWSPKLTIAAGGNTTIAGDLDTEGNLDLNGYGITSDDNAKFYVWRAINNTASASTNYKKIARVTGSHSTRFMITLTGRSQGYGDGQKGSKTEIYGQLNNDNNYDITFTNYGFHATGAAVTEVGYIDIDNSSVDVYVKVSSFSELAAYGVVSDGSMTPDSTSSSTTTEPTNYTAATSNLILTDAGGTLTGDLTVPGLGIGSLNTNFDLYNNGTSYFNGAVTVDDDLSVNGDISVNDNQKLILGTGDDFKIFHNGSGVNYVQSFTSAELRLESNGNTTIRTNNGEDMAVFVKNGAVELYHDNSKRFNTAASGVVLSSPAGSGQAVDLDFLSTNTSGFGSSYVIDSRIRSTTDGSSNAYHSKLEFYTNDTSNNLDLAMTIDSSQRVGIGVAPSGTLHAYGTNFIFDTPDGSGVVIQRTGNTAHLHLFPAYSSVPTIMGQGQGGLHLGYNSNTSGIRIDTNNKVLIGDIASHTDDLFQIETPASGGGHGIQIRRNDANGDQQIGRILFGNNTDTDLAQIAAKTDGDGNGGDSGALLFSTQPTGGSLTERMRIDSSGNLLVGTTETDIGFTDSGAGFSVSPLGAVQVARSSANELLYLNKLDNDGDIIRFSKDGAEVGTIQVRGGDLVIGTGDTGVRFNDASNALQPHHATDVTDGTIDLGLSNYRFKDLFLSGVAKVDSYVSLGNNGYIRGDASGELRFQGGSTATTFYDSSNVAERMRINQAGNVGIGTSNPGNKLDIKGTVGFEATNSTNRWLVYTYTDNTLRFNYNGSGADEIVIDSSGKVGIGTVSPSAPLHVVNSSTPRIEMGYGGGSNADHRIAWDSAGLVISADNSGQSSGSSYLDMLVDGSSAMRIDSSQNATFKSQVRLESGTGGTTDKIVLKTTDNADESKFIRTNGYYVEFGGHANEGFKFIDTNGNTLLAMYGGNNALAKQAVFAGDLTVTGRFNTTSNMFGTGDAGTALLNGTRLGFDESGVRSWSVKATGGNLGVFSGDGAGALSAPSFTTGGTLTVADFVKSTGNNLKLQASNTHVLNIDLHRRVYPNTHNSTDLGFSTSLAFRDLYLANKARVAGSNDVSKIFLLPNTAGAAAWIKLGNFNASNSGVNLTIEIVINNGYNASAAQNNNMFLRFKTSNGSSNVSGFYADMQAWEWGDNSINVIKVVQNSTTSYDFYLYAGTFSGTGSFIRVNHGISTWTSSMATQTTDPGGFQCTIRRFIYTDEDSNNVTLSGDLNVGAGTKVDATVLIASAAGGDPHLKFNTGAVNRNSFIDFFDQGNLAGSIGYIHNGDTLKFSVASNNRTAKLTLDGAGNGTFTGNVTAYSDERLKSDIETLDGAKVLKMRGVSYTRDGEAGSGVIAQELEQVASELVHTADDQMGTKSVAYANLTGYLIEAVKMQAKQIAELQQAIEELKDGSDEKQ